MEDLNDGWGEEPDWVRDLDSDPGDNDENDGDAGEDDLAPAQHVILLLDCGPSMFQRLTNREDLLMKSEADQTPPIDTPVDWSLRAFQELYQLVIKTTVVYKAGKRNGLGALLYDTRPRSVLKTSVYASSMPTKESKRPHDDMVDDDEDGYYHKGETTDDEADDRLQSRTVHELVPLDLPSAPMLKKIMSTLPHPVTHERLLNIEQEYGRLARDNPSDEPQQYESHFQLPVFQGLDAAKDVFNNAKCVRQKPTKANPAVDAQQIWILTNDQSQHLTWSPSVTEKVKERVQELQQAGIQIYVWQLPNEKSSDLAADGVKKEKNTLFGSTMELHSAKFWSDLGILLPQIAESEDDTVKASLDYTLFAQVAFRTGFKLRPSFSVPMLLPDWNHNESEDNHKPYPGIQVDFYKIVKKASKPTAIVCHAESGKEMHRVTKYGSTEELIEVGESRPGKGYTQFVADSRIELYAKIVGDNFVMMRPDDLTELKRSSNANPDFASLILIGFKPRHQMRFLDSVSECYFMYPQESKVEGSNKAFAQLVYGMRRKGVMAVGELLTRVSATSRCVAFWPIVGEESGDLPPQEGMVLTLLPFEDENRSIPIEKDYAVRMSIQMDEVGMDGPVPVASSSGSGGSSFVPSELVDATTQLIKKQSLNDRVLGVDFLNAYLSEFFTYLEKQALRVDWRPSNDYDTLLTPEHEQAILDAVRSQIDHLINVLPEDSKIVKASGKRKALTAPGADETGIDWEEAYDNGTIGKQVNKNLAQYCAAHGLTKSGNKSDLVDRVTQDIAERRATSIKAVKLEPEDDVMI